MTPRRTVDGAHPRHRCLPPDPHTHCQLISDVAVLPEDSSYANVKLAIMVVSCVFGCVAQFYPLEFPHNRLLLAVCVVAYFGLSAVLQYFTTFNDRDLVWQSRPPPVRGPDNPRALGHCNASTRILARRWSDAFTSTCHCAPRIHCYCCHPCLPCTATRRSRPQGGRAVYVRGLLPKYGDTYTLVVESPWRHEVARHSASVGSYFTSAGEFVEAALQRDIEARTRPAVAAAAANVKKLA